MADATILLEQLREDPKHRELLADLLLDAILRTPAQDLFKPEELMQGAKLALSTLAGQPKAIGRVLEELNARIGAQDPVQLEQSLGELLPMTLVLPLQTLLSDPVSPSRRLLAALLDHPGMRQLIEELLTHELAAFGQKLRRLVPETPSAVPGKRLASRIAGVAKGVAAVVGSEIEKQMEERTRDFVDGALAHSSDRLIDRMASPEYAPQLAAWRVDVLHALLSLPLSEFQGEWNKINKDALAPAISEILDAAVQWEGLDDLLAALRDQFWPTVQARTLQEILEPMDAIEVATDQMRAPLIRMITQVMAGQRFAGWLESLSDSTQSA